MDHRLSVLDIWIETLCVCVSVKRTLLGAPMPEVAAPKSPLYRSGNRIASRMRRNRRDPRIEGNAPDHLPSGTHTSVRGVRHDWRDCDLRYDDVDVPVVVLPDDGVDRKLDEYPEEPEGDSHVSPQNDRTPAPRPAHPTKYIRLGPDRQQVVRLREPGGGVPVSRERLDELPRTETLVDDGAHPPPPEIVQPVFLPRLP